ncbi:MAG: type VI secretion system-associated protein TagF [Luteimonas sp.]
MHTTSAAGFFGKLPGAGDFVRRRLPPDFIDTWDRRFSRIVAESRDLLGPSWPTLYHASPVWRFLLAPGVCGQGAWAGVMGPSSDRVGRCFPMVIAARLPSGSGAPGVLHDGGRWYADAARLLRGAQDDSGYDADSFSTAVAELALPPAPGDPTVPVFPAALDRSARDYWLPLPAPTAPVLSALWTHMAPDGCGLWWCGGDDWVTGRLFAGAGLPGAEVYVAFLDTGLDVASPNGARARRLGAAVP